MSTRLFRSSALLLLATAGCGGGTYPVEGKLVWQDGSPATELAGSQVLFEQVESNTSARGTVNGDATFRLTTHQPDDGAVPGRHQVIVLEVGRKSAAGTDPSKLEPGVLDPKFYNFDTSGAARHSSAFANARKRDASLPPRDD